MVSIWVLRLSHRVPRDKRITTHVALVARAFGADGMYFTGDYDPSVIDTVKKVNETWGGDFKVEYAGSYMNVIRNWRSSGGKIVLLAMYGIPINRVIEEIRADGSNKLVVVGSEKVPRCLYDLSDWNVSITTQPHSEVAALAIFLHEYFEGKELDREFEGWNLKVIPQPRGKLVVKRENRQVRDESSLGRGRTIHQSYCF